MYSFFKRARSSSCEDKSFGVANPSCHAAQLVWFITIQNRNKASKDYGKYIWYGMPLWDNRSVGKINNATSHHDAGTDTLIYSMGGRHYLSETNGAIPQVGVRSRACADVYPIIKSAFAEAISKGYLGTTQWQDLAIGGMNYGFEVPGTYNIAASMHDVGVYYK
jgi:hypothetical protein